ncbi:JAB domain-containing protein [Flavobacterium sp.]|uniref:JAB domain-containing protein n=1 Tax=Flavobacterium sp. TaxID=239 RepID=UPI002614DAAC|nr:JAB domain-containing protein [Flavobacterium sp.]
MKKTLLNVSEIKITYSTSDTPKVRIKSGEDAYNVLLASWDLDTIELQEEFKILLLNRANEVLGLYPLSKGGITGTVVDLRLIFAVALKCNATGIIIYHNHPSGKLLPSETDITLTKSIGKCSELLGVSLLDHLIISKNGFYSFSNEGKLS